MDKNIINYKIKFPEVRITGENIVSRVVTIKEAHRIRKELGLDMVLLNGEAKPPVVKLISLDKYIYQQKKYHKEQIKKQKQNNKAQKEVRISPNISDHDLEIKKQQIIKFITKGHKVKITMLFKGRAIKYNKEAEITMLLIAKELSDIAKPENLPKLTGKKLILVIKPK